MAVSEADITLAGRLGIEVSEIKDYINREFFPGSCAIKTSETLACGEYGCSIEVLYKGKVYAFKIERISVESTDTNAQQFQQEVSMAKHFEDAGVGVNIIKIPDNCRNDDDHPYIFNRKNYMGYVMSKFDKTLTEFIGIDLRSYIETNSPENSIKYIDYINKKLIDVFLKMSSNCLFHGDLHANNIGVILNNDGILDKFVTIDYGMSYKVTSDNMSFHIFTDISRLLFYLSGSFTQGVELDLSVDNINKDDRYKYFFKIWFCSLCIELNNYCEWNFFSSMVFDYRIEVEVDSQKSENPEDFTLFLHNGNKFYFYWDNEDEEYPYVEHIIDPNIQKFQDIIPNIKNFQLREKQITFFDLIFSNYRFNKRLFYKFYTGFRTVFHNVIDDDNLFKKSAVVDVRSVNVEDQKHNHIVIGNVDDEIQLGYKKNIQNKPVPEFKKIEAFRDLVMLIKDNHSTQSTDLFTDESSPRYIGNSTYDIYVLFDMIYVEYLKRLMSYKF